MRSWSSSCSRHRGGTLRATTAARLGHDPRRARRPGVTLALLWQEYRLSQPKAFSTAGSASTTEPGRASWTCDAPGTSRWREVVRRLRRADVPVIDRHSGEIRQAQVFVAVLVHPATPSPKPPGRSSYLTAGLTCPLLLLSRRCAGDRGADNLRSAVSKSHRYEPDINPSTAIWPSTMAWRWCRRGRVSPRQG